MSDKKLFTADIKFAINYFIASAAPVRQRIAVIDSEQLNSTKILTDFGHKKIDVINYIHLDTSTINPNAKMRTGVSTPVLERLCKKKSGKFGAVYLDYCGTPRKNHKIGFSPQDDMIMSHNLLADDGILVATFSQRGVKNCDAVASAMIGRAGFQVLDVYKYFHTSAMVAIIAYKGSHEYAQRINFMWSCITKRFNMENLSVCSYVGCRIKYQWNYGEWYTATVLEKKGKYHKVCWDEDDTEDMVRLRPGWFHVLEQ